jgi:succinoglycan biosynthesis transport protein ExoP
LKQLNAPDNSLQNSLSVLTELYSAANQNREQPSDEPSIPLSHYVWLVRRNRWRIAATVGVFALATFVISKRLTPMYEATAVVDVDRQSPSALVGQDASRSTINDADQFLATQMRLVTSDAVLRPVAEKYHLREIEKQNRFWGSFSPSKVDKREPVMLKQIHVSRPPNTYLLMISYRSPNPELSATVANTVAQTYLQHTYEIRYNSSASLSTYMERQLEELKAKMERSSAAMVAFERELNVINPDEKTSILASRLLQLNADYTNAQGERVKKQAAFESVKNGSMEAAQVSMQGESLRRLSERLSDAEEKYADVSARFGENHPDNRRLAAQITEIKQNIQVTRDKISQRSGIEYAEAVNREGMMRQAVETVKSESDRLNARSFEYQSAKREADADKGLYEELIRKIREATINTSFQNSAVRIADLARPAGHPVFPNTPLNMMIAIGCSFLLSLAWCVVGDVLDNSVRDPEQITRDMNTVVLGSLPSVRNWRMRIPGATEQGALAPIHSFSAPHLSGFKEAVRTLHSSILLADFDRKLRSILVTSASSSEGKSTAASHLALAHAEQGKRTLLIDGDLRRPNLHKRFGVSGTNGLAAVLEGTVQWKDALTKVEGYPQFDLLPAGHTTRGASELVGKKIAQLMEEFEQEYDLVVLDGPPAIGFAEPIQMASAVDGVVVVMHAGQTKQKSIAALLGTLKRLRVNVLGVVLNQVHRDVVDNYYYSEQYGKYGAYGYTEVAG